MQDYIVYQKADGRILYLDVGQSFQAKSEELAGSTRGILPVDGSTQRDVGFTHYVVDGSIVPRPTQAVSISGARIAADGVDQWVITGLEEGTQVEVYGPVSLETSLTDPEFALTTDALGHYQVIARKWPYQDIVVEFDAV